MSKSLKGKRILFFGVETMGYERKILDELKSEGAYVDYHSERPVSSTLGKIFIKLCPSVLARKTEEYYSHIIEEHKGQKYDCILIIKCDTPTRKVLIDLKKNFPNAELRLHLWDSLENVIDINQKLDLFDRITSFDRNDCIAHPNFAFRPLFYCKDFENDLIKDHRYDLSFCGTIHTDRYRLLESIKKQCETSQISFYTYYYLQSKIVFYYYKITNKDYRNAQKNQFHFVPLPTESVKDIFKVSSAVIDIQHPHQVGLTMRSIETLGAGKKLITTNQDIINYDFYNSSNICIVDRNNPQIPVDFLQTEYVPIPLDIREKYTLRHWVNDVIMM